MKASNVKTYTEVLQAIEDFCTTRDDKPRYTFGHNVLDDLNLSDGHIKWCLRQKTINDWFNHANGNNDPESKDFYDQQDYEDLTKLRDDTICFLRWLLDVPEEIRD